MSASLLELYQDPGLEHRNSRWLDIRDNLDRYLVAAQDIGRISVPDILSARLDALTPMAHEYQPVAALLGNLPAPVLLHTFGEAVTAWTVGNDWLYRSERLAGHLEDEGYNGQFLLWSRTLSHEMDKGMAPKSRDILAQNQVMEAIAGPMLGRLDIAEAVQASRRDETPLSDRRLARYGLIPLQIPPSHWRLMSRIYEWEGEANEKAKGITYDLYLDTPLGIAVTYDGAPQAILGVTANGPSELHIRQMHGVRGDRIDPTTGKTPHKGARGLMPLDWQKMCVHLGAQLAQQLSMQDVSIVLGSQVKRPGWHYMTDEKAVQAYDVPAERLGFAPLDDRWVKPAADILDR